MDRQTPSRGNFIFSRKSEGQTVALETWANQTGHIGCGGARGLDCGPYTPTSRR